MSIFTKVCWQHWPSLCRCPPYENEIGRMRAETFLLDRELWRENRRAGEFAKALSALASGILRHHQRMMEAHGEDGVSPCLYQLTVQAKQASGLISEPRNEDRVQDLYQRREKQP